MQKQQEQSRTLGHLKQDDHLILQLQLQLQHELFFLQRHDGRVQLRKQLGMQQDMSGQEQQQPRKHEPLGQLGLGQQQMFEQHDPSQLLDPMQLQVVQLQHLGFLRWHEHSDWQQQQKLTRLRHGIPLLHRVNYLISIKHRLNNFLRTITRTVSNYLRSCANFISNMYLML